MTMEIPKDITEKSGKYGEGNYKRGHKDGKLEGQKVAKSPFATELNNLISSIIKGKDKEGYKAPDYTKLANLCQNTFKIGGAVPDRTKIKIIISTALKVIEAMPLPPKTVKAKTTNPPPAPEPQTQ